MDNFENKNLHINNDDNNINNSSAASVPEYNRNPLPQYRFAPNQYQNQRQVQNQYQQPVINQYQNQNQNPYPYYPQAYVAPQKAQEPENIRKARKKEKIALILGIISLAGLASFFIFPLAVLIPAITSIWFGKEAKKELLKSGKATTGKIFSIISIVLAGLLTVIMTVFFYIPLFTLDVPLSDIQNNRQTAVKEIEDHFLDYYSDLGFDVENETTEYEFDEFYDHYFDFNS
jgi:hypothetical protein